MACIGHPTGESKHDRIYYQKLPYDLSSHAGLAFIGKYLKRVNVNCLIDPKFPVRSGAPNRGLLGSDSNSFLWATRYKKHSIAQPL